MAYRFFTQLVIFGCFFALFSVPESLAGAQDEGGGDPSFGRGGLDLGWGKGEDWDADDDAKEKETPAPSPTPASKGEDSFFKRDVEDTGAGDKM